MKKTSRTTGMAAPRTMADLDAMLPSLGYTELSEANLRAAVRKCRKVYKQPDLSRIPADPSLFDAKWGTGRVSFLAPGFKSLDRFRRWRKDVRAALGRAGCGTARSSASLLPAWDEIVTLVRENQGKARLFGANSDLTLGRLATEASADGRLPKVLDLAWIDARNRSFRGEERKQFKRGVRAMNRVIGYGAVLPEIAHSSFPSIRWRSRRRSAIHQPCGCGAPVTPARRPSGANSTRSSSANASARADRRSRASLRTSAKSWRRPTAGRSSG